MLYGGDFYVALGGAYHPNIDRISSIDEDEDRVFRQFVQITQCLKCFDDSFTWARITYIGGKFMLDTS